MKKRSCETETNGAVVVDEGIFEDFFTVDVQEWLVGSSSSRKLSCSETVLQSAKRAFSPRQSWAVVFLHVVAWERRKLPRIERDVFQAS